MSLASFVHSFLYHGTDHIAKEFRKLKRQKPHIFTSQPRVGSDIRGNLITTYSVYLLSDDPEMSQLIFIFLIFWILFVLFIYLSYILILHIYLFIFIHLFFLFSAVRIRRPFPHFTDTRFVAKITSKVNLSNSKKSGLTFFYLFWLPFRQRNATRKLPATEEYS